MLRQSGDVVMTEVRCPTVGKQDLRYRGRSVLSGFRRREEAALNEDPRHGGLQGIQASRILGM